ncbi:MAG: hypothetical protein ACOX7F_05345 [Eubacteriales bacterium]|jgi:hypothetical protein
MAFNTLEFAKVFQKELDKLVVAQCTSGWMESNAGMIQYSGGDEIKIPMLTVDGLADYDREDGFTRGAVNLSFQTLKLSQDRGRSFQIDAMDVDETSFGASVSNIVGEFQRSRVVPEIDSYRYSRIATLCSADHATTYTADASTILTTLRSDIENIYEKAGEIDLVITLSSAAANLLEGSSEFNAMVDAGDFKSGEYSCRVRYFNGNPIVRVPSARMKSAYTFYDGVTEGQTAGGFVPAPEAKQINWIISSRTAPIAVSKTDQVRIFDPLHNQSMNAWKVDYRKYHDLFVPTNKLDEMWVNMEG